MASVNVTNTLVVPVITQGSPYRDDYNEDKNYYRQIFRPGRAIQARELTQIQTLAQVQTERLGRHIFENGSIVQGGVIQIDSATMLPLDPSYNGASINAASFTGKSFYFTEAQSVGGYSLIGVEDPVAPFLMVRNTQGKPFYNGATIAANTGSSLTYANVNTRGSTFLQGATAYLPDSVFFINGFFVKVPEQIIILSSVNPKPSARVGIEISEEIVTFNDDSSLLDPALESSNYQAPGADRLKYVVTLSSRTLDSTDDSNFIELVRIQNGITEKYIKIPMYAEIEETLARRTYDESGNYTVRPFKIQMKESTSDTKLAARLDPGKAYIFGYEFETQTTTGLDIDRPLDTVNVSNYDISTAYGNYLIAANVQGSFNIANMSTMDIHCVPYQKIDTANTIVYNATKIGTIRLKNMQYEDVIGAATNGNLMIFRTYVFDPRYTAITGNATGGTANTIVLDNAGISSNGIDAYKGMYIRLTAGMSSGDLRQIAAYDNATKTITVTLPWTATPATNTQYSIEGSLRDAESFVIPIGSVPTANLNISTESKEGNDVNGAVLVSESDYNTLLFRFPNSFLKANTGLNQYQYRKFTPNKTFSTGKTTVVAATGETPIGTGILSDTIVNQNHTVIITDNKGVAGLSNGAFAFASNASRNVAVSGSTVTYDTGINGTFTADIITEFQVDSGALTLPKTKTKITGNTTHLSSYTANGALLTGTNGSISNVYLLSGQTVIVNPNRTPGAPDSLYVSDIHNVSAVYDLNGATPTAGLVLTGYTNILSKYRTDNGQTDNYYDHGSIRLKPGVASPRGPIVVCYDYYRHDTGTSDGLGFFSIDSYPNITTSSGYADVPSYTTETGTLLSLRDVIDFRPARENASNTTPGFTLTGVRIPTPNEEFTVNYDYYMPRRDLIVLTRNRRITHVKGISSENPRYPDQPKESMLLYKLDLPPYTLNPSNVTVHFVENKRYTMRDIGKLEKRIENLEYYTTLSVLEKQATDLVIRDGDGLERTKYGIIADKFIGHQIGDVTNPDYNCSMDTHLGELRPPAKKTAFDLSVSSGSNYKDKGSILTLDYTSSEAILQDKASTTVNLQPYNIGNFVGEITLYPDNDSWIDTNTAPDVVINTVGVNDNWSSRDANSAFTTETNDFQNRWFTVNETTTTSTVTVPGLTAPTSTVSSTSSISPESTFGSVSVTPTGTVTQSLGENVIDVSVIPYIRSKEIYFKAKQMRPERFLGGFFDNRPVDECIQVPNKLILATSSRFDDNKFETITSGSNSATVVLSSRSNTNTVLYVVATDGTFAVGQTVTGALSGNSGIIVAYDHRSGNAAASLGNTANIKLQVGASSTDEYYTGNNITLVTGPGRGSIARISSYNGASRIASVSAAFMEAPTTATRYSIGQLKTNSLGEVAGMFSIPSGVFRTGDRVFKVGDYVTNHQIEPTSRAWTTYFAQGFVQQRAETILSTTMVDITSTPPNVIVNTETSVINEIPAPLPIDTNPNPTDPIVPDPVYVPDPPTTTVQPPAWVDIPHVCVAPTIDLRTFVAAFSGRRYKAIDAEDAEWVNPTFRDSKQFIPANEGVIHPNDDWSLLPPDNRSLDDNRFIGVRKSDGALFPTSWRDMWLHWQVDREFGGSFIKSLTYDADFTLYKHIDTGNWLPVGYDETGRALPTLNPLSVQSGSEIVGRSWSPYANEMLERWDTAGRPKTVLEWSDPAVLNIMFNWTDSPYQLDYTEYNNRLSLAAAATAAGDTALAELYTKSAPNTIKISRDHSALNYDERIYAGQSGSGWGTDVVCGAAPNIDPVAQSFTVDRKYPNGMFLESVDVIFRTKDTRVPVRLEIRPIVNGYPHSQQSVPNSDVYMYPDEINVTESPDITDNTKYTRFTFKQPIYLLPSTEYCIVMITTSKEYEVWVSQLGQTDFGTERLISEQPYMGSLFRSQNQSTWTAYQDQDLTFRLNRCVFTTSNATITFVNSAPSENVPMDWMYTHTNDIILPKTAVSYAFKAKSNSSGVMDASFTDVVPNKVFNHSERKVFSTTGTSYQSQLSMRTASDHVSPIIDKTRQVVLAIENIINNAGLSNNLIVMTQYGSQYNTAANVFVTFSGGTEGSSANAYVGAVANGNISSVIIDTAGSYYTSRANIYFGTANSDDITTNAAGYIISEMDPYGGPALAKYITRKVVLKEGFDAGDLRVFIDAYKPLGTEVEVYYKLLSADDTSKFEDREYQLMEQSTPNTRYSPAVDEFIEYEYRPSLSTNTATYSSNTGTYNTFRTFAIKIVLLSDDTIKIPVVKNFRAIALPGSD